MKKQEIIDGLTLLKQRLHSEVIPAYKERGSTYGSERYKRWKSRVIKFLDDTLPGESSLFDESIRPFRHTIYASESDEIYFMRIYGVRADAYIESLLVDLNNDEYEEIMPQQSSKNASNAETDKTSVFIVHGHDREVKQEVARFIENLDLKAIILHEQSNGGKTIIEKLEEYTNVGFAVILYTPCDVGKAKADDELRPRARQNVVFEHGLLIGRIGIENVFYLVKGDIELPGDLSGVVYEKADIAGAWKTQLLKEMEKSGYQFDNINLLSIL